MPRATLFGSSLKHDTNKKSDSNFLERAKPHARSMTGHTANSSLIEQPRGKTFHRLQPQPSTIAFDTKEPHKRSTRAVKRPAHTPGRRTKGQLYSLEEASDTKLCSGTAASSSFRQSEKRKSANKLSNSTLKRAKTVLEPLRYAQRSLNLRAPDEEVEDVKGDDDIDLHDCFLIERSPSPSPASFKPKPIAFARSPSPSSFSTKTSVRSQFVKQENRCTSKVRELREHSKESIDPSPDGEGKIKRAASDQSESQSYLNENKLLIRRITSESLKLRGLHKQHAKFKDLFAAVCRGVQFAMREALEKRPIDTNLTKTFVESHLAMYMILNSDNS